MAGLQSAGMIPAIRSYVASGRLLLGICLGMQMLLDGSDEFGQTEGLGLIPGRVVAIDRMRANGTRAKLPSIGWAGLYPASPWEGSALGHLSPGAGV